MYAFHVRTQFSGFEIDDDSGRIDFCRVHEWLTAAYWSPGVTREKVERAAKGSASVIGVYQGDAQVAYCRVVSDQATFAWLCDVFVDENFRKKGIAKAMVKFALNLPYSSEIRKWVLATRDAHAVYEECGFTPLEYPDRWMWRTNSNVV